MDIEVGQVLWRMSGTRQNDKIKWYARPMCVERLRERTFHDFNGSGGSFSLIGNTYFLSRQEAIDNHIAKHGSLEETIGIDDELSEEQKENVIERQRTDWNDKKIFRWNGVETCGVYSGGFSRLKDITGLLVWNLSEEPDFGYKEYSLTLREIYDQLSGGTGQFCGYEYDLITVFQDSPMRSDIYQCNNYGSGVWVKIGVVMGYA